MSESINNDQNRKKEESQGSGNRVNEEPQQDPSGGPMVALEVFSGVEDPNYWKKLVTKLMKRIPSAPSAPLVLLENPSKSDKLADRVVRRNPKVYGNLNPV